MLGGGADSLTLKTKKNAVVFCFFLTKLSRISAEQSSAALAEISRWIFLFFVLQQPRHNSRN